MGRGPAVEQLVDVLGDALLLEPLVMAMKFTGRPDLHREQVPDRPHLERGACRDPRQHLVEVIGSDQVGRGREHAAQSLLHRLELVLEGGDLLGRALDRLAPWCSS